ncbi:hypothetical protein LSH36_56g05002 [Paralvinella palmiformis]|uniref:Uncharacterized protein n=1 Tax=Paralvinella palmiformis TaxID=53620 RepID=A0AAD9K502_9ANNE|nr:hypothetical protein LSH36_56g05002 [Paralvinella palmiformis]
MANKNGTHVQTKVIQKFNSCHLSPDNTTHSLGSLRSDTGSKKSEIRTRHMIPAKTPAGKGKSTKWNKLKALSLSYREQQTKYGNTYKIGPDPDGKFDPVRSRKEIEDALKCHLDSVDGYHRDNSVLLCRVIAEDIKRRIKFLGFARYRIVSEVVIGENVGQGLQMGSRCVWDLDTDKMVTVTYQNNNLFAVATVYGVYFE